VKSSQKPCQLVGCQLVRLLPIIWSAVLTPDRIAALHDFFRQIGLENAVDLKRLEHDLRILQRLHAVILRRPSGAQLNQRSPRFRTMAEIIGNRQ